ncbi:ATP-binding protein [Bacilliculturomica massiliensis]|uniref:ATP-binding protein n=1 Tax=Bacilliculturomica massiliensis TaxID=1917867 RepID=UPI00103115D4|nr:ATP-binding protein [Bacilliculturomica massiliensis]
MPQGNAAREKTASGRAGNSRSKDRSGDGQPGKARRSAGLKKVDQGEKVRKDEDQYAIITDYLRDSMDCKDLQSIAAKVERAVRRFADNVYVGVSLNEDGRLDRIVPKVSSMPDYFIYKPDLDAIAYETLELGQAVHHPVSQCCSPETAADLRKMGGRSVLCLPIFHGEAMTGVLTVVLKEDDPPRGEVIDFCTAVCGFLAVQMRNAVLHQTLEKELNDKNRVEADLDVIFRGSVDMIGIFDRRGYMKRLNPAFETRLGYSRAELFSMPITALAHPEDRDYVQYVLDNIVREENMHGLCHRFLNKEKRIIFLELNVKYLTQGDEIVFIARDVTNQREVEARNMALEQSIALERMKTEFFSNVSHEFKTPINIILSSVDLLKLKLKRNDEKLYNEQYKKFFTYTQQNSFKLLRLINNLLDCTKIDSGSLSLLAKNCFIVPFVRQVVETTQSYAATHKINMHFDTDVDEKLLLYCDPDKIDRIILNLISNSIKHTQEGGAIQVGLTETPTHVQLSVADNGEGIPAKMLPHIFEKFKVYEEGFVKSCDGTGVGLSIVKGLAELHGGTVSVRSKRGEGTIFVVSLSKNLEKTVTAKKVKLVSQQQDDELHQSRLQMEMSDIE